MDKSENLCGASFWHPSWLQKYANSKMFIIVYGFLGTIQAMSYLYFVVTLTTLEKRFKIPSQTTGLILSGNEVSQILLSLVLSYEHGGQRNRPRWISWGVIFCALSCFILALPHFFYGAGDDILKLTKEYYLEDNSNYSDISGHNIFKIKPLNSSTSSITFNDLCQSTRDPENCVEEYSIVPLVLIFMSQFVLGIGNTLYYSLGQAYLDDNTRKENTPMLLAYAMSLRMFGPVVGFVLGYVSLNVFIDPTRTPLIDKNDPRWLGAWWLGWIILGLSMLTFAFLIGLFPKELPKTRKRNNISTPNTDNEIPLILPDSTNQKRLNNGTEEVYENYNERRRTLEQDIIGSVTNLNMISSDGFSTALLRLLKNKLLMYNIVSGIFYILGSSGYITFLSKYMEVQFNKSPSNSTIVTGPLTIVGMVLGLLISGHIISKYKPKPSKLFFWNVIVGFVYMIGQLCYLFLFCENSNSGIMTNGVISSNISNSCNSQCSCDLVSFNPVCYNESQIAFFSPCHAGCENWNSTTNTFTDCKCIPMNSYSNLSNLEQSFQQDSSTTILDIINRSVIPGSCTNGCFIGFYLFALISSIINCIGATGRIGNILVNFRAVEKRDKSFSQGLAIMLISLLALIPGPILYGRIIDKTCLIWNNKCDRQGNCQLYDQQMFRYYINGCALLLTSFGIFFDVLVWHHGKNIDLYGEDENNQPNKRNSKT